MPIYSKIILHEQTIFFNSKTIITGDITQIDLPNKSESGLIQVIDLLKKIDGIEFCMLSPSDVVRHKLVKDIIKAYDKQ